MATKRKSVEGKNDANKRTKKEDIHEEKDIVPIVEDITTARERARLWHEQQMKLAGMRSVEESITLSQESGVPVRTRTRSTRLSEIKVEPIKRERSTRRQSEVPISSSTRTRSRGCAVSEVPESRPSQISSTPRTRSRDSAASQKKVEDKDQTTSPQETKSEADNTPSEEFTSNTYPLSGTEERLGGFQTIEQRINSQPKVLAEISDHAPPVIPSSEEVPPEYSWISLPYIAFFCVAVAVGLVSIFRTEQCIVLLQQLKTHLHRFNYEMINKFGPAPLNLDYTSWLSAFGIVFIFSFVL